MTHPYLHGSAAIVLPLLLAGCSTEATRAEGRDAPQSEAAAPSAQPATASSAAQSGSVLETIGASSYTYLRVDTDQGEVWLAAPQFSVSVGDEVAWQPGMPMSDWHSDTLDRTWDVVYLVSKIQVGGSEGGGSEGGGSEGGGSEGAAPSMPAGHPPAATATTGDIVVEKLDGGSTVEELYARAAELSGQHVALRGKVVKANFGIMGSNWLHVQDGTGGAGDRTNDLTVTTQQKAAVGDVVIVKGTLVTDKDFGAGYRYAVLIEDATVETQH